MKTLALNSLYSCDRSERSMRAHADGRGGSPGVARGGVPALRPPGREALHRRGGAREHRDLPRVAAQHVPAVVPRPGQGNNK